MAIEQISVLYYCTVLIFAVVIYVSCQHDAGKKYRRLEEEFKSYKETAERYFQESDKLFEIYKEEQEKELKRMLSKSVSISQNYCDDKIDELKKDILEDGK